MKNAEFPWDFMAHNSSLHHMIERIMDELFVIVIHILRDLSLKEINIYLRVVCYYIASGLYTDGSSK